MSTKVRIPSSAIPDLVLIRDIGQGQLATICDSVQECSPLPLRRRQLLELIEKTLDPKSSQALLSQTLTFLQLIRTGFVNSHSELLESLRESLQLIEPSWDEAGINKWQSEVEPHLARLLISDAFRTVAKAADLEYEFANLYLSGRVITDVRPIFNDESNESLRIDGAVVSHTLRLLYDNREGEHVLSLALDISDISSLKEQCERALQKAQRAKAWVEGTQIPVVISGDH